VSSRPIAQRSFDAITAVGSPSASSDRPARDDVRTTRFLELTDPATVSLCLDTGHIAYAGGDNRAIVARHPDRIGYVHLKSIDPVVLAKVRAEGMSFAQAVQLGAMVEPTEGVPEMPPLLADLDALGVPLTAIVEHDLYPTPPEVPLPIATRTCRYYSGCGLVS
jgi:inosose dehydratase